MATDWQLVVSEGFEAFSYSEGNMIQCNFHEVEQLMVPCGKALFEDSSFCVYTDGENQFYRCYLSQEFQGVLYAVSHFERKKQHMNIWMLPGYRSFFNEAKNCFFHIAFEELLLSQERIILHASFIKASFGGILFSGPSGIGKSTQAKLWERYREAIQINGDRPILGKVDNHWMAYGSPYSGSSRCYINESAHIKAIVILDKAKHCKLERLSPGKAFQKLYAQIIIDSWNPTFVEKVCTILEDIVTSIPVFCLYATPDENAVYVLEQELLKGCI